jgi:hypothetical protein
MFVIKFGVDGEFCIILSVEDELRLSGRFKIEISGVTFGDFECIESIGTAVAGLYDLPGRNSVSHEVFLLPNKTIVDLVREAYFEGSDVNNFFGKTGRAGSYLVLTGVLAAFDDFFLVLIEDYGKGRFVWRIGDEYSDAVIDTAVYGGAIGDFVKWWEQKQ